MLIPEDGLWRFCSSCNKEGTKDDPALWSEAFRTRLCMDCMNMLCEAIDAEEEVEFAQ